MSLTEPKTLQVQEWFKLGSKTPSYKQLKQYAMHEQKHCKSLTRNAVGLDGADSPTNHATEVAGHLQSVMPLLDDFTKSVRKNTYMLWAKTYNLSWAFHVFKSMNDTGRPLTAIDKLKALVLSCWSHGHAGQIKRAAQWDESIKCAGGEKPFAHVIAHMAVAQGMDKSTSLLDFMVSYYCFLELSVAYNRHECTQATTTQTIIGLPTFSCSVGAQVQGDSCQQAGQVV